MPKRNRKRIERQSADRGMPRVAGRLPAVIAAIAAAAAVAIVAAVYWSRPRLDSTTAPEPDQPAAASFRLPPRPQFPPAGEGPPAAVVDLRDEAFEIATRVAEAFPSDPDALCLLGSIHRRYASEDAARTLWQRCLELDPRCDDAHYALGLQANSAGDFAAAEKHLLAAIASNPAWKDVPLPLVEALEAQNKTRQVVELLEPHVQRQPGSSDAWCRLGQAYHRLGDPENARRCHLAALQANPQLADAHHGAALALEKLGQPQQAQRHFREFQALRRDQRSGRSSYSDEGRGRTTLVRTCVTAGQVYQMHGQSQAAEEHWRRAAALDETAADCRQLLHELLVRQERWQEAVPFVKQLCELAPTDPQAWMNLGIVYGKSGHAPEAEAAFRRVIDLAPNQADPYAALAEIEMLPGRDLQAAVRLAEQAVALAPTARHYYVLSVAQTRAGNLSAARTALEQALRLNPEVPEYREAYARLLAGRSR
jgi:tetratricopeptide (TPR) repeat protein